LPVACSLDAGALAQRGDELRSGLFAAVEERRELPDGIAYRFPGTDEIRDQVLAFAAAERTCCAFFRIELAFEPSLGPIWLTLRGPDGTKDFVRQTFDVLGQETASPPSPSVPVIARDEIKALLDRGEALTIIEALPEMYYRKAHLPGALNIPVDRVDELSPVLLPDKAAMIVVYCADLACPSSRLAAERLIALGYRDVREYAEGKQDWLAAGYPTERDRPQRAA
jgi:rhodanese-related sulfurtransferase